MPAPSGPWYQTDKLQFVTHFIVLTAKLIHAERESLAAGFLLEDQDFIADLNQYFVGDLRRDRSWAPLYEVLQKVLQNSYELSWPETCLLALQMLHIAVITPQ